MLSPPPPSCSYRGAEGTTVSGLSIKGGGIWDTGNAWVPSADVSNAAANPSRGEVFVFVFVSFANFGCLCELGGRMALAVLLAPMPEAFVPTLPCVSVAGPAGNVWGVKQNEKPG